jgi:hypothetical protein
MVEDRLEPVRDVADPFIDDIVIGSKAEEGEDLIDRHYKDIRRVLDILKAEKLVAEFGKCNFFATKWSFADQFSGKGSEDPPQANWPLCKNGKSHRLSLNSVLF